MTFGEFVKEKRGESTRLDIAARSGISVSYMGMIESDRRTPTRDILSQLAGALKLDADERDYLVYLAGMIPEGLEGLTEDQAKSMFRKAREYYGFGGVS